MNTLFLLSVAFYLANALLTGMLCELALRLWKAAYATQEDPALLDWLPMYQSVNRYGPDRAPQRADRMRSWGMAFTPCVQTIVLLLMVVGTSVSLARQEIVRRVFGSQCRMDRWLARPL